MVEKLKVRVLPCVIAFVGGVSADRIVGFEGVGGSGDAFETGDLEKRLVGAGVLEGEEGVGDGGLGGGLETSHERKSIRGSGDDDDDEEWD